MMTPKAKHTQQKKIIVVDDHSMLRRGLISLIESEPNLKVCAEAANQHDAIQLINDNLPNLVIVDLCLENSDGLDLVKHIKTHHPDIPTLVLSMNDETLYAKRSLRAGAMGYVTKQELDETLLVAIHKVLLGEIYLSPKMVEWFSTKFVNGQSLEDNSSVDTLSDRELHVFRLIGQGKSTRNIAKVLSLSIKTIESHLANIKQKLNLKSAVELAHRATHWVDAS